MSVSTTPQDGKLSSARDLPSLPPGQLVSAGVELFAQEVVPSEVTFISEGVVKLVWSEPDGREMIVGLRLPGWFLGSTSALMGCPTPASAITLSRCRLQRIAAQRFVGLVRSDPEFSWRLHRAHSHEIHDNVKRLTQLASGRSMRRLEQVLRELVSISNAVAEPATARREIRLELPMKHYEIAALIAVTPEHLSRLLHHLESEGRIRLESGVIVVPDPAKL
jgi:CRP-like cAMP-binding protein